jgi:hypothetical protein
MNSDRIGIGIRILRGKAIAIALRGDDAAPSYAGRAELMLSDPKLPSTLRPFHAMARLPLKEALPMVKRDEELVRKAASNSMSRFVEELRKAKVNPRWAAIVSDDEPARISNPHLKAHEEERRLFREAAASAAAENGIKSLFLVLTEVARDAGGRTLGVASPAMDRWLADIAVAAGCPWRADEKTAAIAAWIALSRQSEQPSQRRSTNQTGRL